MIVVKEDLPKPILIKNLGMMFPTENSKWKRRYGLYKCGFCGEEFKTQVQCINSGGTKSCGCYHIKRIRERIIKHGLVGTRLYIIWRDIKNRVYNPKCRRYSDYGG
jgi:hypothetical protein